MLIGLEIAFGLYQVMVGLDRHTRTTITKNALGQ